MRIGIVGGIERCERAYRARAERDGHELRFHSGYVGGRGSARLESLVRAVELVVVLTDVNSHGAVQLARGIARARGVPVTLRRRFSPAQLASLLGARPGSAGPHPAPAVREAAPCAGVAAVRAPGARAPEAEQ